MAVIKTKAIKSNVRKVLRYAMNPEKTDEYRLVTAINSFVDPEVEKQFERTRESWNKNKGNLAYRIIQSFSPKETDPETANKIGYEMMDKLYGDRFEIIVATHMDKDHIHNHIIVNGVSFKDGKKIYDNKATRNLIRKESDRLCKKYGLHVIENPKEKGKSYKEWQEEKRGFSWKEFIKNDIDDFIEECKNFEEFKERMIRAGYEIKEGKHISFRPKDKERFVRGKTLGKDYTEEAIKKRIKEQQKAKTENYSINWRSIIRKDIDEVINQSRNLEEFKEKMKELKGYEIKHGKYLSFRPKGKERFVRGKTLGENYTEEAIRRKLYLRDLGILQPVERTYPYRKRFRPKQKNIFVFVKFKRYSKRSLAEENFMLAIGILKILLNVDVPFPLQNKERRKTKTKKSVSMERIQLLTEQLKIIREEKISSQTDVEAILKDTQNKIQHLQKSVKEMEKLTKQFERINADLDYYRKTGQGEEKIMEVGLISQEKIDGYLNSYQQHIERYSVLKKHYEDLKQTERKYQLLTQTLDEIKQERKFITSNLDEKSIHSKARNQKEIER